MHIFFLVATPFLYFPQWFLVVRHSLSLFSFSLLFVAISFSYVFIFTSDDCELHHNTQRTGRTTPRPHHTEREAGAGDEEEQTAAHRGGTEGAVS